jgi:hypothetical protein
MKKLCAITAIIVCFAVGHELLETQSQESEWLKNREIIAVTVPSGAGIDYFGSRYAPDWMDLREYRTQIMELNNMDSAMLYAGQTLYIYK